MTKRVTTTLSKQLKPFLLILFISFIGLSINLFPISLFANVSLTLGNIAFIIVAIRFGVRYSLFSALLVSISLNDSFGHPFGFMIFGLEAMIVSFLYRKGWYVLNADLLYWFVIGMPITAIVMMNTSEIANPLWLLTTIKQGFNGLVYTCIAGLLVSILPKIFDFPFRQQPKFQRPLRFQVVHYSSLIISFSIISTSLLISQSVLSSVNQMIENNLIEKKDRLVFLSNNLLEDNDEVIQGEVSLSILENVFPEKYIGKVQFILTDRPGKVLLNTTDLPLNMLDLFEYHNVQGLTYNQEGLIRIDNLADKTSYQTDYFHAVGVLSNGWQVHVLLDSSIVIDVLEKEYIYIFILMFVIFLISLFLINKLGGELSQPLRFIHKQISNKNLSSVKKLKPLRFGASTEIFMLYDELCRNKEAIDQHQFKLEELVAKRTKELKKANAKLTILAEKDALTQVYNRGYFDNQFRFFQKTAQRSNNNLAVILLDLDHFKAINDQHGHLIGDQCLRQVASLLSQQFSRETDLVARYGGEEFVILITDIRYDNLVIKLDQIRKNVTKIDVDSSVAEKIQMTISIGAIIAPACYAMGSEPWVKKADDFLYKAKGSGRNKVLIDNLSQEIQEQESQYVIDANAPSVGA